MAVQRHRRELRLEVGLDPHLLHAIECIAPVHDSGVLDRSIDVAVAELRAEVVTHDRHALRVGDQDEVAGAHERPHVLCDLLLVTGVGQMHRLRQRADHDEDGERPQAEPLRVHEDRGGEQHQRPEGDGQVARRPGRRDLRGGEREQDGSREQDQQRLHGPQLAHAALRGHR